MRAVTASDDDSSSERHRYEQTHASDASAVEEMIHEQEQPLLSPSLSEPRSADVRSTVASATGARILHALPQFSQWLQGASSQAQLQIHDLQHQDSSGTGLSLQGPSLREHPSDVHSNAIAPERHAAPTAAAHMPSEHYRSDGAPLSRRRALSAQDAAASDLLQSSSALHDQRGRRSPRFGAAIESSSTVTPLSLGAPPLTLGTNSAESARPIATAGTAATAEVDDATEPLFAATTGLPPPPPHDANGGTGDDQSALDELQVLFRRCHHSLPFVGLFIIYFAYQHTTGIVVFVVGTVAIMGLDQRVRAQIALKDRASVPHLLGVVLMCAVDTLALCCIDGELNPLRHLAKTLDSRNRSGTTMHDSVVWDVLWTVVVNDFIIRLWSVAAKAIVAVVRADKMCCKRQQPASEARSSAVASASSLFTDSNSSDSDLESGERDHARPLESPHRAPSTVAFYRRKRKLYGIIELISIFVRSLLAGVPWCSYYQLCASKFIADTFTFGYIFIKAVILGAQARRIVALVRSFLTLGLEFGVYVSLADVTEAGSPDCSICYDDMQQPVKLACSHMFCEACVTEWFDRERSCPLCRASMATSLHSSNGSDTGTGSRTDDVKPQYLDGSTSLFPQLF